MGAMGLRERKKLGTRRALAKAALELFVARGFDGTTVEDIAAAADVSPRTFFRYFATKEDVVFADEPELIDLLRELAALGSSPSAAIRAAVHGLAERFAGEGSERAARIRLAHSVPAVMARSLQIQAQFEDVVAEGVVARLGPGSRERAQVAVGAAFGVLRAAMRRWAESDGATDPVLAVDAAFDRLGPGLGRYLRG